MNSHERYKIDGVLTEMKVKASEADIEILQQVCAAVSIRAARLAAAGLATIIKVHNVTHLPSGYVSVKLKGFHSGILTQI